MKTVNRIFFIVALYSGSINSCRQKSPIHPVIANPDYKKGTALIGQNNDSAYFYFNKIVNTSKDSLEIASSYNNMAAIQSDAGDYFGAQESLLASLRYLKENNERDYYCLSSDYNELGTASLNLKNYPAAINYYGLAIKFSRDSGSGRIFMNNLALCYQKTGRFAKALELYHSILSTPKLESKTYARVMTNMATTKWLQDSTYPATHELWSALAIRKKENDEWGLNSSFGHLAEYYLKARPDSAFYYADQLYGIAQKLQSPDDELDALQKMILTGEEKNRKAYFLRYQFLNDSLQTARNNAKNQFALIRYDAEKNKSENLRLQRDNADNKLQIFRQRVFLYAALFVLVCGTVITIIWYRKRRQTLQLEADNAIRQHELKTSQKVHDVVANGLYRIMSEIEHKDDIDKPRLLDNIEALYEKSRDISYEPPAVAIADFGKYISTLLMSFSIPTQQILITGNQEGLWNNFSGETKKELEHVLQEIMVNMKKHSEARYVVIKFERQENQVVIQYIDDGIGLSPSFKKGNGIRNTENRMKRIGGGIIFDSADKKGLRIRIHLPISK